MMGWNKRIKPNVWAYCGCSNKGPQVGGLKQENFILMVLETRNPIKVSAGPCCLQRFKEESFISSSFRWLPAILGVPWLVDVSFQSQAFLLCVSDCVSSSHKNTGHIGPVWPHWNLMTSAKTLFSNKVTFADTGVRTSICLKKWNWKSLGHVQLFATPWTIQ